MEHLDTKERIKLEQHKEKIGNLILMWGGGVFILILVASFIPMGLLPSKRRFTSSVSNPDLSIFESMGVFPTLLMIVLISGTLSLYLYHSFKFGKISKDLIQLKKITLNVKVKNVVYKQGEGPQEIDLFFSPPYNGTNKVEFIGETNFPRLHANQDIELVLTKIALYPLSIKSKNNIDDIMSILNKIQKKQD